MKSRKKKSRGFLSKAHRRRPDDLFTSSDEERRGRKSLNNSRGPKFKAGSKEPIVTANAVTDSGSNPASLTEPDAIQNKVKIGVKLV